MFNGFEPVFDKNSRILILGSFPSVKSRKQGFYYGNKQNRFWRMLETIFKEKIGDDILSKKEFLFKHGIALFDVVEKSNLEGSADDTLEKSNFKIADFDLIFKSAKNLEKVLCNGKTAYNLFTKNYALNLQVICMPSTSSANPRFDIKQWEKEFDFMTKK